MVTAIVGIQWGDEGKGRVSNFETKNADMVVRATGGNNAGHTVVKDGQKYALHLLPSSIIEHDKMSVISSGVVIDPAALITEIRNLQRRGIWISADNLAISNRAQVTLPIHIELDKKQENLKGDKKIGTTGRGIGPTYTDKAARIGICMYDLINNPEVLLEKLEQLMKFHNAFDNMDEIYRLRETYVAWGKYLRQYIKDTTQIILPAIDESKKIVLEGAQSTYLGLETGRVPYVTSSDPTASGTCAGAGIGPMYVEDVIGVMKAYCSRVGEGPFPTEQKSKSVGARIRELGHEYGTTTGRPRRCGWLDLVMIKHACKINSLTGLALNHMDTIGNFSEFKVCVGYKYHGKVINYVPIDHENCKPIYKIFKGGWKVNEQTETLEDLGPDAVKFVEYIEDYTGVPVVYIGIGPDAKQTIVRG